MKNFQNQNMNSALKMSKTTINQQAIKNHSLEINQEKPSNKSIVFYFFVVPLVIVIAIALAIRISKNRRFFKNNYNIWNLDRRSQEKYNLNRLIDPQKQGFNRLPNEENSECEAENSDSEVEEFNRDENTVTIGKV